MSIKSPVFIGLISGTSADGIDAVAARFSDSPDGLGVETLGACIVPYEASLRAEVLRLSQQAETASIDALARLDHRLGLAFANAARTVMKEAGLSPGKVAAIGSHGQTLRHDPNGEYPFTWQIGDPNLIAERTGIATVADFRRRDVAAGGQGAPLMPAFHAALLHSGVEDRAVLNLGGIGNLTLLPREGEVIGFDTGPANGLMDAAMLARRGEAFDRDGALAAQGKPDAELLAQLLADPYFALPPPKSTGRDAFHLGWLAACIASKNLSDADLMATLLELSARSIANDLTHHQPETRILFACGGGVRNGALMRRLAQLLPQVKVNSTAERGIDPDFVEALGFAWLARQTLANRPGNLPSVTGARGLRVLGAIHPG